MHGLVNRSIQCFLRDTYGAAVWGRIARNADLASDNFEPLMSYEPMLTTAVLQSAVSALQRPLETVLEDLGTYLVSSATLQAPRRLLRFGGISFYDFLHSLEDLPERGRLALPDLALPQMRLADLGEDRFTLFVGAMFPGVGHVVVGVLRAMADDYGALVLLDHVGHETGGADSHEQIAIHLLDQQFSEGRQFDLAQPGA